MKRIKGGVTAPKGFYAAGMFSGIKRSHKKDLAIIFSPAVCTAAGTFTANKVKAAPVLVDQQQVKSGRAQAIVANAGNANCCTGAKGLQNAWAMIKATAKGLHISPKHVLVCSTGVIGVQLPIAKVKPGIAELCRQLVKGEHSAKGGTDAADAIMTTDVVRKEIAVELNLKGRIVRVGAMAKGAGMISPRMHATMLAFITTDAKISAQLLRRTLSDAVEDTFNSTVIDNDMSTNDTVLVLANGMSKVKIGPKSGEYHKFAAALKYVCDQLAQMMVADGEGATKVVVVEVAGAKNTTDAKKIAKAIVSSDLFKCMVFGGDPNFGRMLAAIGYSGAFVKPERIAIDIEGVPLVRKGIGIFSRQAPRMMRRKQIRFKINLGVGRAKAKAYGCDMTFDYVRINSKYRT